MLNKVLIANRGEIAVRVIRSCRELDITTVAVYSQADRTAPHVLLADEALCIGPPPAKESYLDMEAILAAARKSGADAIHPGYGFLSENASFAKAVQAAGLVWIGATPDNITKMGDKVAARRLALEVGAPIVPGGAEPLADIKEARKLALQVGYPVLVKAAGGGGGKGMRTVQEPDQLDAAIERARSEAASAFTDDRVYLEKALAGPHHVEIQVFADSHGNVVSLGERECSIQRRYQKVIEETPSPFISPEVRHRLSELAMKITVACDYRGAGTVEFLVDRDQNYYFLEMNTRLQVEHPITEMVTGLDLVAEQLRVADGEALSFTPADIRPRGHAIESRIYAEDGFDDFTPSTGTVLEFSAPGGPGVRLDHGLRPGLEITPYYDPLLGKLCAWGRTRAEAIARMTRALEELRVVGLRTTIPFCLAVMQHPAFKKGGYSTSFINDYLPELVAATQASQEELHQAAALGAALFAAGEHRAGADGRAHRPAESPWLLKGRESQQSE